MQGVPDAGIRENFFLWNLESWAFESGIHLKASEIP